MVNNLLYSGCISVCARMDGVLGIGRSTAFEPSHVTCLHHFTSETWKHVYDRSDEPTSHLPVYIYIYIIHFPCNIITFLIALEFEISMYLTNH